MQKVPYLDRAEKCTRYVKTFYASDIFNEKELISEMENHASVTFDSSHIVCCWRNTVTQKYTNLPGLRELHVSWQWRIQAQTQ